MRLSFLIFSLTLTLTACYKDTGGNTGDCLDISFNDGTYETGPEDANTVIEKIAVDGDCLELILAYSGGCQEHEIGLAAVGWIKTLPVQVEARVIHENLDPCEAWLHDTLRFDLRPLRYRNDVTLVINLKGLDEPIVHSFIDQ